MSELFNEEYEREKLNESLADLDRHIAIASAWKQFFTPSRIRDLLTAEVRVESFGLQYGRCDVNLKYEGSERDFREIIKSQMLEAKRDASYIFKRTSLYDKNAYITFPLSWFVATDVECHIVFGLPLPMVFAVSSFTLKHVKEKYGDYRWGRLYCNDARLEPCRRTPEEVASIRTLPIDSTRAQMFEMLLEEVKDRADECWFTITGDDLVGAAIKAWSDAERVKPEPQILELEMPCN
jgi:hypothetical protein